MNDFISARKEIQTKAGKVAMFHLPEIERLGLGRVNRLPYSLKVLLESAVRNFDGFSIRVEDVKRIAAWEPKAAPSFEIAFKPGRVILQDFTGVPTLVDLAAMRSAMKRLGGDYRRINPQVPCDLVVDHSVQVDYYGSKSALAANVKIEFERNRERYEFLKWGQKAFRNFRVVPPATGIVHQVNLEYLAQGVLLRGDTAFPDSLVGTDSHTTMINGLGVVGWGVGGIEAEAVMLGEPIFMLLPQVVGFKLKGALREGVTATDLVLTVTEMLRKKGVVGKFVEYFGEGLSRMTLPDRATLANMAPEYGATMGFFPVDDETLRYYRITGRSPELLDLIERYMKEQGMFYTDRSPDPEFSDTLELDLGAVEPSLAGPKRPHDRVRLADLKKSFLASLEAPPDQRGFGLPKAAAAEPRNGLGHGDVVIAAITSCTNTSNPSVMIGAGILAKKAVERGLSTKPFVKTSLAPGSTVVTEYLKGSGLEPFLEKLGFYTVGFGCTTCIGNSGPLPEPVAKAVKEKNLVVASVLSGNRNFEGRINPLVKANYLASPPLVVAFALAGKVDIDFEKEPVGKDQKGRAVYLRDIWPTDKEIRDTIAGAVTAAVFRERYQSVFEGNRDWDAIGVTPTDLYGWDPKSTYIQEPPFFTGMQKEPAPPTAIRGARVLALLGDSVTTDHISPAGDIAADSPAGRYLIEHGVQKEDFNSYGARRGNDRVMVRGTFANVRLRNSFLPQKEGWWTIYWPEGEITSIYEAGMKYQKDKTPLLILAGAEYGSGSSRDWAAKGTALLGVKAVIAESYERIHRSNLVGMGVLPLEFKPGETWESLALTGDEYYDLEGIEDKITPGQDVTVVAKRGGSGKETRFKVVCRIDTPIEAFYYRNGGILPAVIRKLLK